MMNDYNSTCHPTVLEAIKNVSERRYVGYGADEATAVAVEMIRQMTGLPDAYVQLMPGGTITNLTAISAFLRPHEAVVAPSIGHIYVHETGAIEATGHKVLTIQAKNGKAQAADVLTIADSHTDEHMVKPKLLYISQTTELGTVYTKAELKLLRNICDEFGMYLYIDGARLGYAVSSKNSDLSIKEIASMADAFYIGGTKNGLLFGEALVICNPSLAADFRHIVKQRGALMSKGFLLGMQFQAILLGGLYFELAAQANDAAARLTEGLRNKGIPLLIETESNQVFPVVQKKTLSRLEEQVVFEVWARSTEAGTPIRFVTSWQTTDEDIESALKLF